MIIDGIYYGLGFAAGGVLLVYLVGPLAAAPLFLVALFCLYFFRDPERQAPPGPVAVSPADGQVVAICAEGNALTRVSVFLNIFDVHVNRAPIAGKIVDVAYHPGRFLGAYKESASEQNEQNVVTVEGEHGRVIFKQIAGLIARRVVFYKKLGDAVRTGERVGLIKFGSRVDLLLGPEWEITVHRGERVRAGSSILARRKEV